MKPLLKVPPPVLFIATAVLMWLVACLLQSDGKMGFVRLVSCCLFVFSGIGIIATSVYEFYQSKTTLSPIAPEKASTLVISGIYDVMRNPMYVGLILLLVGWGIWLGSFISLILVIGFATYLHFFQVLPEESALSKVFERDYERYLERVPRWLLF